MLKKKHCENDDDIFLSSGKELLWVAFVGWLVGLLVVGKNCGKMWKLNAAMRYKTKRTELELIVHLRLFLFTEPSDFVFTPLTLLYYIFLETQI